MRFGRRVGPTASYAALVAERHLWVVLDEPGEVSLRGLSVATETEVRAGQHATRLDLADLPEGEHDVVLGRRAVAVTDVRRPPAGAGTVLLRDDEGHLRVVRRSVPDGVTVRALRLRGERVEVDLSGGSAAVLVDPAGGVVAPLAVLDGTLTIGPDDLVAATPGELRVLVDGRPVRRRANALADPGAGALLPAVHPVGAEQARARLRWTADATLAVRVLG